MNQGKILKSLGKTRWKWPRFLPLFYASQWVRRHRRQRSSDYSCLKRSVTCPRSGKSLWMKYYDVLLRNTACFTHIRRTFSSLSRDATELNKRPRASRIYCSKHPSLDARAARTDIGRVHTHTPPPLGQIPPSSQLPPSHPLPAPNQRPGTRLISAGDKYHQSETAAKRSPIRTLPSHHNLHLVVYRCPCPEETSLHTGARPSLCNQRPTVHGCNGV